MTRAISGGTVHYPGADAIWPNAEVTITLERAFVANGITYPCQPFIVPANDNGVLPAFVLATPPASAGAALYRITLPDTTSSYLVPVSAGAAIAFEELLALAMSGAVPASALRALLDAHASVIAAPDRLGHFKPDNTTITIDPMTGVASAQSVDLADTPALSLAVTAAAGSADTASRSDHAHPRPTLGDIGAAPASHLHTTDAISNLLAWLTARFVPGSNITITPSAEDTLTFAATSDITQASADARYIRLNAGAAQTVTVSDANRVIFHNGTGEIASFPHSGDASFINIAKLLVPGESILSGTITTSNVQRWNTGGANYAQFGNVLGNNAPTFVVNGVRVWDVSAAGNPTYYARGYHIMPDLENPRYTMFSQPPAAPAVYGNTDIRAGGTPEAGFGARFTTNLQTSTEIAQPAAHDDTTWTIPTYATRTSQRTIWLMLNGALVQALLLTPTALILPGDGSVRFGGAGSPGMKGSGNSLLFVDGSNTTHGSMALSNAYGLVFRSDYRIAWAPGGIESGGYDTGLHRASAGVVEVNNGTIGQLASIRAASVEIVQAANVQIARFHRSGGVTATVSSTAFTVGWDGGGVPSGLIVTPGSGSASLFAGNSQLTLSAVVGAVSIFNQNGACVHLASTTPFVGINTASPQASLHHLPPDNAATNSVVTTEISGFNSSGTPATGFGKRRVEQLKSSTTADRDASYDDVAWADATHATRSAQRDFWLAYGGGIYKHLTLGVVSDASNRTATFWNRLQQVAAGTYNGIAITDISSDGRMSLHHTSQDPTSGSRIEFWHGGSPIKLVDVLFGGQQLLGLPKLLADSDGGGTVYVDYTKTGNVANAVISAHARRLANATGQPSIKTTAASHEFWINKDDDYVGPFTEAFRVDTPAAATETGMLVLHNGSMKRVEVGAADSAGVGFRALRITN